MKTLKDASDAWLEATAPDPEGLARVASGVRAGRRGRRTRSALGALAVGVALAAGVAVALRPSPIERTLEASGEADLSSDVRLSWAGLGHAGGWAAAPRLSWTHGRLDVDVTPEQGIDLQVVTDEAQVSVVGTRFIVNRDVFGTHVEVVHGVVHVRCATSEGVFLPPVAITAAESTECRPVRAVGLLQRARALDTADPAAALLDVEAALLDPARPASLDDELRALRIGLLDRLGRGEVVVPAALAYVGGARTDEVARIALTWADGAARCELLGALQAPTQAELAARCTEPSGPVPALRE